MTSGKSPFELLGYSLSSPTLSPDEYNRRAEEMASKALSMDNIPNS